jgi:hypothetical protein
MQNVRMKQRKPRMKVYCGNIFALGEQVRAVMAARSFNAVAKRLGQTYYTISRMWSETGNDDEISRANERPGNPIVVSCLSRNEAGRSMQELQDSVDRTYQPKTYTRPYIRRGVPGHLKGVERGSKETKMQKWFNDGEVQRLLTELLDRLCTLERMGGDTYGSQLIFIASDKSLPVLFAMHGKPFHEGLTAIDIDIALKLGLKGRLPVEAAWE